MPLRRLVLASGSPARLSLLRAAGFDPEVVVSDVPEDGIDHLPITEAAVALAERKALAVTERLQPADALVVGCDSMLAIDGTMRGKPASVDEARAWLRAWRGRRGTLVTGQCVVDMATGRQVSAPVETEVRYGDPTDAELDAYLA